MADQAGEKLYCLHTCAAGATPFLEFDTDTRCAKFGPEVGLPGRVDGWIAQAKELSAE